MSKNPYGYLNDSTLAALQQAQNRYNNDPSSKDRAVNYNADGEGTHILYESVAKAVCNVRASAPLAADWSAEINADYQKRRKL